MAKLFTLPDGSTVDIPDYMDFAEADARAKQRFPEAYGIEQKHGFVEATKAGLKEGAGSTLKGIGALTGWQGATNVGQDLAAPDMTPGAYHPYTDAEVEAQKKKGLLAGLGAQFSQNISEPVGGALGAYAIPTAASMLVPGGALARGAAFVASALPAETSRNIDEQQRVNPAASPDLWRATSAGLVQAAIIPVLGGIGEGIVKSKVLNLLGPDIAATTKAVMSGQMTKEQAIATLNSTARNMAVRAGEVTAVGAPMMVGTEALRMGQAGEDLGSPESQARLEEAAKAAVLFAPVGALGGAFGRRGQIKKIEGADKRWQKANEMADAAGGDRDTYESNWKKALESSEDTTGELGLNKPTQPKGKDVYRGAEEPAAPVEGVVDPSWFNGLTAPKSKADRALRAYEGTPLDSPKIEELKGLLDSYTNPETAPKWMTDEKAARIDVLRKSLEPEKAPEQLGFDMPAPEVQAARDATKAQADWQAKMQSAAGVARGKKPPTEPNAMRDMFSGKQEAVDMSTPAREPVETVPEFNDRNEALYAQFQKAHEEYQRTGDDTALKSVLDQAREELGPMNERLNQASTQKMFDKRGKPTRGATAYEPEQATGKTGASDAAPVQGLQRPGDGRAEPAGRAVEPSIRDTERSVVGEERQQPALTATEKRNAKKREARAADIVQRRVADESTERAAALERERKGLAGIELTPEERAANAKARLGATEKVSVSPTGIGRAAKTQTLDELTPTHTPLKDVEDAAGHGSALWWNDLAQIAKDLKSAVPAERKLAIAAKEEGLKKGTFTEEQLANAVRQDTKNVATINKFGRKTAMERERERINANKEAKKQARDDAKHAEREGRDVAGTIEKVLGKKDADARMIDRLAREEEARSAEHEQDPDAHMYRKGEEKAGPAHSKSESEATVKNATKDWKNAPAVEVKTLAELSEKDRARAVKEGAQGWYKDGVVTIIHDHNHSVGEVKATLFHEALGHYGLRSKFKAELDGMLKKMYETNPELKRLAERYRKDNPKVSIERAAEEVLAERQIHGPAIQSVFNRVVAWVRDFARKAGMDLKYTDNDIASILRRAGAEVTEGGKGEYVPMGEGPALMRKREGVQPEDVPAKLEVTLEREGKDGNIETVDVRARATLREAARKVNVLEALMGCISA